MHQLLNLLTKKVPKVVPLSKRLLEVLRSRANNPGMKETLFKSAFFESFR
jgi:hypothetical protein